MSFGLNTNVRVGEIVYHVQTEQRGADADVLDTIVYISGRVIHRVQSNLRDSHAHTQGASAPAISERVKLQHESVVAQIESGALRPNASAAPTRASKKTKAPVLTIRPLNLGLWLRREAPPAPGEPPPAVITVELIFGHGAPAAGATVEARIECYGLIRETASASADSAGKAIVELQLSAAVPEVAVLVLRAASGASRAELRYRMKPRPAPAISGSAK